MNILCFHIKNEPGMRYSKESLDAEKRKDPDKTGARLSTQVSYSP